MAARKARRKKSPAAVGGETLGLDPEALRYWRLQRGWTQEALARQRVTIDGELHGLSYAQIRRMEADGRCGSTSARILAALLDISIAQLSPRDSHHLPCGLPREPSADFVGRESELKTVLTALQGTGSVRIAAAIEGLPGIGKTELALQVCGLCERERRFRIFWFDAEQPDLSSTWADVVAPHLGIDAQTPEHRASQAIQAIESLAEPVLLVLDNVEEWSASRPWPRPRGRHIHWLTTTRRSDLGGREFQHVDLPVLEPAAAERLMLQIAGTEVAARPGFGPLIERLGGYTIAVELAAAFLRRFPEVEPEEYCRDLESGRAAELESEVEDRSLYGRTLERALELLWNRLPARVRGHWQLASQFAQAPVSSELSDAAGLDRRARAELRDYHLLDAGPARSWSMHRLVRSHGASAGARDDRVAARRRFLNACVERSELMGLDAGFQIYAPDREHYDLAIQAEPGAVDAESLARLRNGVAKAIHSLGDYRLAKALLERALEEARVDLPAESRTGFRLQAVLGFVLFSAGELAAAREVLEDSLGRAVPVLGGDDQTVADLRNNLAVLLTAQGELPEARSLYEQALASGIRTLGESSPDVAQRRSNLAQTLRHLGELEPARVLLEEALDTYAQVFDETHPDVACTQNNLALVLRDMGELREARQLLERALQFDTENLSEQHSSTANRRANLGLVLRDLGELEEARQLFVAALASDLEVLGDSHPAVALHRSNLALVYHDLGEFRRARELFEQSIASGTKSLGENHRQVALSCSGLGRTLHALGDYSGARAMLQEGLKALVASGARESAHAGGVQADLAWVLRDQGALAEAREQLEGSLAMLQKAGREASPVSALVRARLARLLLDLRETGPARARAEEALRAVRDQPEGSRVRNAVESLVREVAAEGGD